MRAVPGEGSLRRDRVRPELRLETLGFGSMDLWAVIYHAGRSSTSGHYHAVVRGEDGRFRQFDDRTKQSAGFCEVSEDVVEFQRQGAVRLMVYVRAGGSVDFAEMLAAPPAKDAQGADGARPKKTPAATVEKSSDKPRSAPVVSTPPRTRGASAFAGNPAPPPETESRQSTPSEPMRKRQCVQCSAEVDDTWGQMSVGTVSAVSTPGVVRSPPAKVLCLRCTPKSFAGASVASVLDLPEAPPWPGSAAASTPSAAVAGAGERAQRHSPDLAAGLHNLSLESPPPREGMESRVDPVLRVATAKEEIEQR